MLKKIKDLTNDERQRICEKSTCDSCVLNIPRVKDTGNICLSVMLNFIGEDDMQNVLEKIELEVEI